MSDQFTEPRGTSKNFLPLAVLTGVVMFIVVAVAFLAFSKSNNAYLQSEVMLITGMSDGEMTGLSINEIKDAKKTLMNAQRVGDFPESVINRELQALDAVLDRKLTAGS